MKNFLFRNHDNLERSEFEKLSNFEYLGLVRKLAKYRFPVKILRRNSLVEDKPLKIME